LSRTLIAVPTLGRRNAWLRLALTSIQRQRVGGVRIVVVGSSRSPAAPLAAELGTEYHAYDRPGQSAAINEVWRAFGTDADYFGWLCDDDVLSPISLLASTGHLDRHPECAAVYGRIRIINADGSTVVTIRPGRLARVLLPYSVNQVPQPGSLFRADAVQRLGYLDESLTYAMDQDLFLRLRRVGRLDYLPVELAAYRRHPGTVTMNRRDNHEEELVRSRNLSRDEARRYALLRRPMAVAGWVYSSVLRKMPAGTAARVGDREYVRAGLEEPAQAGVPSPVPAWKAAAIRVESLIVRGAVHSWDKVFVRWDRRRRLSRAVVWSAEVSDSSGSRRRRVAGSQERAGNPPGRSPTTP
jgi:GT2 family glycosyltransferase